MTSRSLALRVVLGLAVVILLVKVVSDRKQLGWYPRKQLTKPEDAQCPDITLGPEPHLAWPNWAPFADILADEVAEADRAEVRPRKFPLTILARTKKTLCAPVRSILSASRL